MEELVLPVTKKAMVVRSWGAILNPLRLLLVLVPLATFAPDANGAGAAVSRQPATSLNGWEKYRFGMTIADAKKLSVATSNSQSMKSGSKSDNMLFSQGMEYGQRVRARLQFLPNSGLKTINLEFSGDRAGGWTNLSPDGCEKKYQDILKASEARFGVFAAPERATSSGSPLSHSVASGRSRYSLIISDTRPGWGFRSARAIHGSGKRFATAQMQFNAMDEPHSMCRVSLALVDSA